jgi:hypothetical protein
MQASTFTDKIDGVDIEFTLNRLKFRSTERVLGLVSDFRDSSDPKKQIAAIREAFAVCVSGWSIGEPFDSWDEKLEIVDAVRLVEKCLRGNSASEGDRKK